MASRYRRGAAARMGPGTAGRGSRDLGRRARADEGRGRRGGVRAHGARGRRRRGRAHEGPDRRKRVRARAYAWRGRAGAESALTGREPAALALLRRAEEGYRVHCSRNFE
ncbi:hypothetical protein GCM10010282_46330 [Streptomyces roseolus]|nr:hypothetical protein GCM10010282_46330 [Streptomyces roseolus]